MSVAGGSLSVNTYASDHTMSKCYTF